MNQKFNNYVIFALFKIISCIALPQSTTNSRCGAAFGGITCANYPGATCCSQYGYCGYSEEHCSPSKNCQSGCWATSTTTYTSSPNSGEINLDWSYKILIP
ncbi:11861_t:CDS:1, partial [Cetraspora pellucida]